MRTSSMSSSKGASTGGLSSMIPGNKKTFDIITNATVRFKDVAGLNESKVEVK
jgi:hypothetical protein